MAHAKSDDAATADLRVRAARISDDLKATIPEDRTVIMSPQVLLTRIHVIATILTVALAPGAAISLFNALRTQSTVPQGLLMGTFVALLSVSLCTCALIRDQRRNIGLANARLAEDVATLQPATECEKDERQARIASAEAQIAALVREQHQALIARITALEQSVSRGSGQS